jgi:signal transduction histidine kinase
MPRPGGLGHVSLTVADDGKGIPDEILTRFEDGAASSIGLAGMRERLAEFGGEMRADSSVSGTIIAAIVPTGTSALEQRHTA